MQGAAQLSLGIWGTRVGNEPAGVQEVRGVIRPLSLAGRVAPGRWLILGPSCHFCRRRAWPGRPSGTAFPTHIPREKEMLLLRVHGAGERGGRKPF